LWVVVKERKNSMKKIFLILPVVLLLAASCGKQTTSQGNPPAKSPVARQDSGSLNQSQTTNPPAQDSQQPFNMVKLAISPQNNSGESGSVTIFDVNGNAKVIVTLGGAPANAVQPDHVHFGSCAQLGGVRYPLTNAGNGVFVTTLPVSLSELVSMPFAINAHKSAAEIGIYVACGDSTTMVKSVSTDPAMGAQ
jgi:hypothetical protein